MQSPGAPFEQGVVLMRGKGRGSAKQTGRRGSTRHWRKLREEVLTRDGHTCYICKGVATQVDHLIPKSKGGPDTHDNTAAICAQCNQRKSDKIGNAEMNAAFLFLPTDTPPSIDSLSPRRRLATKTNRLTTRSAFVSPFDAK